MNARQFCGRQDAVERLQDVLIGRCAAAGPLTIQSIEGPGGIGKTRLFNHALNTCNWRERNYLTLRMDGATASAHGLVGSLVSLIGSVHIQHVDSFGTVQRVIKEIDAVRSQAVTEYRRLYPMCEQGPTALGQFLDQAFGAGRRINQLLPFTREPLDLGEAHELLKKAMPTLTSLSEETTWIWQDLGVFGKSRALRNAIRQNACRVLADALLSDLTALLSGYRPQDRWKPTRAKIRGLDRLLLIIDDYEMLQACLGEFLLGHLLPALQTARFESLVVILGRDQLEATHPAWDQHFKSHLLSGVVLDPLSRAEMDQLVESLGVHSADEQERAWRDTQGYPFYVQLWIEEAAAGGRSALMLRRIYERTTRWMTDQQRQWLRFVLFLDEVNVRTLRHLLESEADAREAFQWFQKEGSLRDTVGPIFRVRPHLRSRLIDYLRISDPDCCETLEYKAAAAQSLVAGRACQQANAPDEC